MRDCKKKFFLFFKDHRKKRGCSLIRACLLIRSNTVYLNISYKNGACKPTLHQGSFAAREHRVLHHMTHHRTVVSEGEQLGRVLLHLTDGDASQERTLEGLHHSCNAIGQRQENIQNRVSYKIRFLPLLPVRPRIHGRVMCSSHGRCIVRYYY